MFSDQVIEGIVISEFHDQFGKQIVAQVPTKENGGIKIEQFEAIFDYIIPTKNELCGKLIIVELEQNQYAVGIPILLRNQEKSKVYKREKYIFNISIVISKQRYNVRRHTYQEMTRKLAYFFTSIEMENHIIYENNSKDIEFLINKIYQDLNQIKECYVDYNNQQHFLLKFVEGIQLENSSRQNIKIHDVPLACLSIESVKNTLKEYDEILFQIYEKIDGMKCVQKISEDLSIDLYILKYILQNMFDLGLIKLVDIFRLSNKYQLTKKFNTNFIHNDELKQQCIQYVALNNIDSKQINIEDILTFYMSFDSRKSLSDILELSTNQKKLEKINLIDLIHFGIINQIIRRVNEYPLAISQSLNNYFTNENKKTFETITDIQKANQDLKNMIDNGCCLDEILVYFKLTKQQFKQISENNCMLLYK